MKFRKTPNMYKKRNCLLPLCALISLVGYAIYYSHLARTDDILPFSYMKDKVKLKSNPTLQSQSNFESIFTSDKTVRENSEYWLNSIGAVSQGVLRMIEEIEQSDVKRKYNSTKKDVGINSCFGNSVMYKDVEDLLCMPEPKFDPKYKNPCWYASADRFLCLPYFQVIGVDKCGSTDLFYRISEHPDVLRNDGILHKETTWWAWKRYGHWLNANVKVETFQTYLKYFANAAKKIELNKSRELVTGDGTPMDFWDMSGWVSLPQNKGLKEPEYTTPDLIKHINPQVKLILILRDPVQRLYSDYFFLKRGKLSPIGFHEEVVNSIHLLHSCTRTDSLRSCLYSRQFHVKIKARIHLGFYSIFLRDWLKVFPRNQFLIIRTEDYSRDIREHLHEAFKFLELREMAQEQFERVVRSKKLYVTKSKQNVSNMMYSTSVILERLYMTFKKELAAILHDKRYLWDNVTDSVLINYKLGL